MQQVAPDAPQQATQPYDRPFDVGRWSDHPELQNCVTALILEIEAIEGRQRSRQKAAKSFRAAIRALVLDLYVAWKADPLIEIGVARGRSAFAYGSRYSQLYLKYSAFIAAFDGLRELDYLVIVREPFNDPATKTGRVTRIRATPKLIDKLVRLPLAAIDHDPLRERIVLKDTSKREVIYEPTDYTKLALANLRSINSKLSAHWYDLYLTDKELFSLAQRMRSRHLRGQTSTKHEAEPTMIDFSARTLHRVFNNGDWEQGGRFYGAWWQNVPRDFRRHITIDDKPTVEIDYSGMHPVMLYAEIDKEPPKDPYDPNWIGVHRASRKLIKLTFNKLLNATGRIDPDGYDEKTIGISWDKFLTKIIEAHYPIHSRFRSGYGLQLQNKDAAIAERVMLAFGAMGYPCLPVHDSFLVHHALQDELDAIMQKAFKEITGMSCPLPKPKEQAPQPKATGEMVEDDILDLLASAGPYKGYETRWREWRAMRGC